MFYAALRTHHLLDHKPDNLLRTGHKHGLTGFYKFGTPGIGVAWAADEQSLHNFLDTLQSAMPQKKFSFVLWKELEDGVASCPSQWMEMASAAELKQALESAMVEEDDYYTILGIEKREDNKNDSSGKKGKGSSTKSKSKSSKRK